MNELINSCDWLFGKFVFLHSCFLWVCHMLSDDKQPLILGLKV
jgi:hypothetical protein